MTHRLRVFSLVLTVLSGAGGVLGGQAGCAQADLDGSGGIGSGDLNAVLAEFGCQSACSADVTGDGATDSLDLNVVLTLFGDACGPGSCCEPNGTPGCDDPGCSDFVCLIDPSCCESGWDIDCVITANFWCGSVCSNFGPCCLPDDACVEVFVDECAAMNGAPVNAKVCDLVFCGTPPEPCGQEGLGPCWQANGTPGCDQEACCGEVCGIDPFCCEVVWDAICADEGCDINCYACGCCAP